MRIDSLTVRNFKGFAEKTINFPAPIDPANEDGSFHALIGVNGSGKTSTLDALAVAMGIWYVAGPGGGWRQIYPSDVHLVTTTLGDTSRFDPAPFAEVEAKGSINETSVTWKRMIRRGGRRTSNKEAKKAQEIIQSLAFKTGTPYETLPVLAYYGAGRAWLPARDRGLKRTEMSSTSRFDAYYNCLDGRIRDVDLNEWFLWERLAIAEGSRERDGYTAVKRAVLSCVPESTDLRFDVDRKEIVLQIGTLSVPFYSLSAGQRSTLALIADLAIKAVTLNPQFGSDATKLSPGMVLIDELDLHLHPTWQRRIVEDLQTTFPRLQFVVTTHSPFVVQTLKSGQLIPLDGQPVSNFDNLGIEAIARGLMGVHRPEIAPNYEASVAVAKEYLLLLEEAALSPREKLEEYKAKLGNLVAPFADNPAFQAFLELKREERLGPLSR